MGPGPSASREGAKQQNDDQNEKGDDVVDNKLVQKDQLELQEHFELAQKEQHEHIMPRQEDEEALDEESENHQSPSLQLLARRV